MTAEKAGAGCPREVQLKLRATRAACISAIDFETVSWNSVSGSLSLVTGVEGGELDRCGGHAVAEFGWVEDLDVGTEA